MMLGVEHWWIAERTFVFFAVTCWELKLNTHGRHPGYFAITYIISYKDMLMIPSRFVGVDGLTVECQAKIVNRQSLPNAGAAVSVIIDQEYSPV